LIPITTIVELLRSSDLSLIDSPLYNSRTPTEFFRYQMNQNAYMQPRRGWTIVEPDNPLPPQTTSKRLDYCRKPTAIKNPLPISKRLEYFSTPTEFWLVYGWFPFATIVS